MLSRLTLFTSAVALFTSAVALCGAALAADQPPSFDALDKDKDGVITATEARANVTVASRFAAADKNQDGYLSRSEYAALGQ